MEISCEFMENFASTDVINNQLTQLISFLASYIQPLGLHIAFSLFFLLKVAEKIMSLLKYLNVIIIFRKETS